MQERRSDRYKKKNKTAEEELTQVAAEDIGTDTEASQESERQAKSLKGNASGKLWLAVLVAAMACLCVIAVAAAQSMQEPPHPTMTIQETPSPSPTPSEEPAETTETPEPTPTPKVMIPEMAALHDQNPDLAGWIKIDGTIIDYPVMYTPNDGEFYLYRTFEGEEDPTKQGCIFIDEHCSPDPRTTNMLLHGHNMRKGTMFHSLVEYENIDYYREHPTIKYTTLYEQEEYEIVYAFRSRVFDQDDDVFKYYKFYQAETPEEFQAFVDGCRGLALYDTGIEPVFGDTFLTLNTCEYSQDNGRMVIVARKVTEGAANGVQPGPSAEATTTSSVIAPPSDTNADAASLEGEITVYGEITEVLIEP